MYLKYFEAELAGKVNSVFMLKGGMGQKQRRSIAEAIAAVPECEPRVILATGSYIGEGFDDARLATRISWRGTLQQYVGVSTDFMTRSVLSGSTTVLILMFRCWRECTRAA
jgi:hypothetical protein